MDPSITCPKCGENIPISKALTDQIEKTLKQAWELQQKQREQELSEEYQAKLSSEKERIKAEIQREIFDSTSLEMADLRNQVSQQTTKLNEFRQKELDFLKRQREIEEKERSIDLVVAQRIAEEHKQIEEIVRTQIEEDRYLKDIEKDRQLQELRKQVEELRSKLNQGSQQLQGEAIELELECVLQTTFPFDQIEPVGKGVRGADILQKVHNQMGHYCGTIIWESKNTKTWSDDWIDKLKDDQRNAKADIAVIATAAMPKDITRIGCIDNVWVTDHFCAIGLATALRSTLIQVENARMANTGKNGKVELLYKYLAGNEFKQRVEGVVDAYREMQEDLDAEKRATQRAWAKREKQTQRVLENVAGMYGDIEGIIGSALQKIDVLELPEYSGDDGN